MPLYTAVSTVRSEQAVRVGLEHRLSRILTEHRYPLARLAASYTASSSDRDDLLQDIAMGLWQALPAFREECSERTFVFRIAHNRAMTYLARNHTRSIISDEDLETRDTNATPEEAFAREEQGSRLTQAIKSLPIAYRQVITLSLEEMEYDQIAMVLGISESNVGARLTRARQMLRKMLEGNK